MVDRRYLNNLKRIPYRSFTTEKDSLGEERILKAERNLEKREKMLNFMILGALIICIGLITFLTALMAELPVEEFDFAKSTIATDLYNIIKNEEGNLFFSPYSLHVVLAMAYMGAGGATAKEFQKSLSFPEDKKVLEAAVKELFKKLDKPKDVVLKSANAMFLQKDYSVKHAFMSSVVHAFKSDVKQCDFSKGAESAKEVNGYVSKHTDGKISELFTPDDFTVDTKLILLNAIYFKGNWLHKFDASLTFKGDFHLNNNDTVKVDFMKIKEKFNYNFNEELNASVLEMKYSGDMSMILIVPKEIEGIKQLENKISSMNLMDLRNDMFSREVQLTMPKFKLEQKMKLKETLIKMGLKEMFSAGKADFSGISELKELYVSDAVQKAFIEVNEEGSEAAAATACNIRQKRSAVYYEPEPLNVDRPFLFFIECQGLILFVGSLLTPDSGVDKTKIAGAVREKSSPKWNFFDNDHKTCSGF